MLQVNQKLGLYHGVDKMPANYKPVSEIRSRMEQEELYEKARAEIVHLRKQVKAENIVAKDSRAELLETREEVKQEKAKTKSFRIQLTKRELASKHAANASKFAAIGGIATELLYQTWDVTGFIGGAKWEDWWTSQEMYGVIMFLCTTFVGFIYRAAHE
jgi:DNA polymerase elongation subunit (family B)